MMHAMKRFGFAHDEELQAKILQMKYEGKNFRMIVILPDDIEGLPALEAKLKNINLSEKISYMEEHIVVVALPKFKMEETMELNDVLKTMGAKTMFVGGQADFSGISDESLRVSEVAQKAFVEVNEEGTEAAAFTCFPCMTLSSLSKPPPIQEFIANHPFLFLITHQLYMTPFFIGRYATPP